MLLPLGAGLEVILSEAKNLKTEILRRLRRLRMTLFIIVFLLPVSHAAHSSDTHREQLIASLRSPAPNKSTLQATLKIGVPHPSAPLVQWTDGLLAYQKAPEFLYLKGYQPLVPIYFLLKSREGNFELYLPRLYSVYFGANEALEKNPDTDLKLRAGDILKALEWPKINAGEEYHWEKSPDGEKIVVKDDGGKALRTFTFDLLGKIVRVTFYNDAGFPALDIFRSNFKFVNGIEHPFELRLKRLVPAPSELILNFKTIRPNEALNPAVFSNQFPPDAKRVELT